MPRCKLTQKTITRLPAPTPTGKPVLHWDADLRGFGVLCSGKTNSRSFIAQRDLPGRKSRRVTIAACNEVTLAKARDRARGLLVDMRRGIDPKRKGTGTLQQTLTAYLLANKELKPQTAAIYARVLKNHLAAWRDRPMSSITPVEVDGLHHAIAVKVGRRGRHSGHSVANHAVRLIKLLYNFAASRDDDLPRNPVRLRGSEWHRTTPQRRPISVDQLADWYRAVTALPPLGRDYLLLCLFTGLRRNEAAALTWDEIDFTERVIRLPAERTKAGRALDLPMTDFVRDLLVARRALGNATYVFPSNGHSGHVEDPRDWLDAVRAATGIQFSTHDLRRTFITVAESANIPPYALKALVNHALGGSVTEGYINMTVTRLRAPAQTVTDALKMLCGVGTPSHGSNIAVLTEFKK
jgi:integrase